MEIISCSKIIFCAIKLQSVPEIPIIVIYKSRGKEKNMQSLNLLRSFKYQFYVSSAITLLLTLFISVHAHANAWYTVTDVRSSGYVAGIDNSKTGCICIKAHHEKMKLRSYRKIGDFVRDHVIGSSHINEGDKKWSLVLKVCKKI